MKEVIEKGYLRDRKYLKGKGQRFKGNMLPLLSWHNIDLYNMEYEKFKNGNGKRIECKITVPVKCPKCRKWRMLHIESVIGAIEKREFTGYCNECRGKYLNYGDRSGFWRN